MAVLFASMIINGKGRENVVKVYDKNSEEYLS